MCLGLLLLLVGACRTSEGPAAPGPDPAAPAPLQGQDRGLGITLDLLPLDAAARQDALAQAAGLGLGWLRLPVAWDRLEPGAGQVRWQELDPILAWAAEHDLEVLLSVRRSPAWARQDPPPPGHWWLCEGEEEDPAAAPPTDPADLARFVDALARRYRHQAAALELWSEPNRLPAWRAGGPDADDYARLVRAVAPVLRAAAPEWTLVSAGLAPIVVEASPVCYQSDLVYLDRLARSGTLSLVDAVGILGPGLEAVAAAPPAPADLNFRRAELHRGLLLRHGLVDKPLWVLATGWQAGGPRRTDGPDPERGGAAWTRETAADQLGEAWRLARDGWPWAGPLILGSPADLVAPSLALAPGAAFPGPSTPAEALAAWPELGATLRRATSAPPPPPTRDRALEAAQAERRRRLATSGLPLALLVAALGLLAWPGRRRAPADGGRSPSPDATAAARREAPGPEAAWILLGLLGLLVNAALPSWPGLVGGILLGLSALRDPRTVALLAVATLPWRDVLRLHLLARPVLPFEGLLLLGLLGLAAGRLARRTGGRLAGATGCFGRSTPCTGEGGRREIGAVLLLLAWSALSASWAEASRPAWFEWRTVLVEPALFYLLLRLLAPDWAMQRRLLQALVLGAAVAAAQGLLGSLGSLLSAWGLPWPDLVGRAVAAEGVWRARGPYGSPNNLALWLGRALPLGLAGVAAARLRGRATVAAGGGAALVALAWIATFSRGSWLLGLPALGLVGLLAWRDLGPRGRRRAGSCLPPAAGPGRARRMPAILAALALALAAALLVLPALGSERVAGTFSLRPGSTAHIRWRLWQSAGRMLAEHPWLGVGPDNFLPAYRDRYVQREVIQERALSHPHNLVLDWATRLGWPGLILGSVLLGATVRAIAAALRRTDLGPEEAAWAWGLAGAQAYALAHGLVDNHFFLVDLAVAQWLLLAAATALAGSDSSVPAIAAPRDSGQGQITGAGPASPRRPQGQAALKTTELKRGWKGTPLLARPR